MSDQMTIGELAARLDVKDSTIRYYEREGLLAPDARSAGNYRLYGPQAVDRLRFIRSAQASGLALEDIRALLDFRDGKLSPCREVQEVIEARLSQVTEQMSHLRHVERVLNGYREACQKTARGEPCPVLRELDRPKP